jgi:hypothetical protein
MYLPIHFSIILSAHTFISQSSGSYKSLLRYFFHKVFIEIVHLAHICFDDHAQVQYTFHPQAVLPILEISCQLYVTVIVFDGVAVVPELYAQTLVVELYISVVG